MDHSENVPTRTIDLQTALTRNYDIVIVGSGISGSILARELGRNGKRVLIIEAGPGDDFLPSGYSKYLETFYQAVSKDNQSPYKSNPNASMPRSPDIKPLRPGQPNADAYWVQNGPFVSDSTYSRVVGGTTMHWEGKTVRMLREDFKMKTNFGVGLDWPIDLDDLRPYYRKAELEIGVSGDVDGQKRCGVEFDKGYVYPMKEMPPTYLDKVVSRGLSGLEVGLNGDDYKISLETFPQGRNGIPNPDFKPWNNGKIYSPVGAVSYHQDKQGERCQGNTNCVPICPIQAKYDARKTLVSALQIKSDGSSGYNVDLIQKAVASQVIIDPASGRVTEIEIKVYDQLNDPNHTTAKIKGTVFILASNAVENAKLMLASGLTGSSKLIGRNLMDHPYLLSWGLLPESAGVGNGTPVTSGICTFRGGSFRQQQASFATDIHNDGWGWATGAPIANLLNTVDNLNKFGVELRKEMYGQISRQLLLAYMIEMLPEYSNRITVDPSYKDALGILRPVISYTIPEYSLKAVQFARQLSKNIFQRLGAEDYTSYDPLDYGFVSYNGQGYAIRGGNHLSGTHLMGTDKTNSVVNSFQRSWDFPNLYLVGGGSMPTIGSSNTTLTIASLCFRTAEAILKDLN